MKLYKMFLVESGSNTEREEGYQEKRLNKKALLYCIDYLKEMISFMKCDEYNLRIRGSSLLIVVNHEFETTREDGGL